MARLARVVAVGEPHHLTQRGNNRQPTFLDDYGRNRYCRLLRDQAARAGMRLLGYCLMTNHVHLVAVPERPATFAGALGRLHGEYARRLHERAATDTSGKTASTRVRSTATTSGRRCATSI